MLKLMMQTYKEKCFAVFKLYVFNYHNTRFELGQANMDIYFDMFNISYVLNWSY